MDGLFSDLYILLLEDGTWQEWYYHRPPHVSDWYKGYVDAPTDVPPPKK